MMASLGILKEQLEMDYAGEKVAQEKQVIGLGVALDYRMTMNAHLEHLRLKALKGVAVLKYAAAHNITQASLYKLMQATMCSRSDCGIHLTQCAPTKAVERLQRVENQTMRLVTGAVRSTSCEAMRYWLGVHCKKNRQVISGVKELMRVSNTPSPPVS
jgi:hypothetical protein